MRGASLLLKVHVYRPSVGSPPLEVRTDQPPYASQTHLPALSASVFVPVAGTVCGSVDPNGTSACQDR